MEIRRGETGKQMSGGAVERRNGCAVERRRGEAKERWSCGVLER